MEQKKRFEEGDEMAKFVTDEQMHYLLADMFGAGLDTTSVTMAWFLLFMALHPEEQVSLDYMGFHLSRYGLYILSPCVLAVFGEQLNALSIFWLKVIHCPKYFINHPVKLL